MILKFAPNVSITNSTMETVQTHNWEKNHINTYKCKICNILLLCNFFPDQNDPIIYDCGLLDNLLGSDISKTCNQYLIEKIIL